MSDKTRKGDWVQTYTGRQFWPLDPRPEDIDIRDIAHSLAHLCRYNGHCLRFYSVAEHCVLMVRDRRSRLSGAGADSDIPVQKALLLHDAAEAYVADVPRPLKPFLPGYTEIETRVQAVIDEKFGVDRSAAPVVKGNDEYMLANEAHHLMLEPPKPWGLDGMPSPNFIGLRFWTPEEARRQFMIEARRLGVAS